MFKIKRLLPVVLFAALLCGCGAADSTTIPANSSDESAASAESSTSAESAESESVPESNVPEGVLRIGITDEIDTMDVHKTTADYMVPLNIFERLFDIEIEDDGSTRLIPALAESYSVSKNGKTYRFVLRDDAYFSDGTKVTSEDVAFSFTRMLALPDSVQSSYADMILGAEAVMNGETDVLKGIKIKDDRTLTITLTEPFSGYLYQLATPACSILSKANVTEAGDAFGSSPELTIGSGPYMVTEYNAERICLELNPYYQGEPLSIRKAELLHLEPAPMNEAFQNGELDILDTHNVHPDIVKSVYKSRTWSDHLFSAPCVETQYIMLNTDIYPLNNVLVRKAIQLAINRQRILFELFDGEGELTDGIFPKGLIAYNEENQGWLQYDPKKARKLIELAHIDPSVRIELAVSASSSTQELNLMNIVRQNLQDVGLAVSVVNYDSESYDYLKTNGKLMLYKGKWYADYNDPDNFIYTFFGNREQTRFRSSNYSNEEILNRIADARTIQDETARLAEYRELERILVQNEAVWVPLFSTNHLFVLSDRVAEFKPYWAGWSSLSLKDVTLK